MRSFIDMTDNQYGKLTVVSRAPTASGQTMWNCVCDCGGTVVKQRSGLINPKINQHCGCVNNLGRCETHGMSKTRSYKAWQGMRDRCNNKNRPDYAHVSVCKRWEKFENFYEDMGDPLDNLSIDRINNESNYNLSNCRWATPIEQIRNRKNTLNFKCLKTGETKTLMEWSKELCVPYQTAYTRYKRGYYNGLYELVGYQVPS